MGPTLKLSRLHHPVTALGPGRRVGIWTQGCSIGCHGCVSQDTWPDRDDAAVGVDDVLAWLDGLAPTEVDGVTISGGEPTDQPAALAALLVGVGRWRAARPSELREPDVLVFTGRPARWLETPAAACLAGADAVVAGPYVAHRAGSSALRGSENQVLVALSELGRARMPDYERCPRTAMQAEVTDDGLWLIGIPLPVTMAAFEERTAARGVIWKEPSWRS